MIMENQLKQFRDTIDKIDKNLFGLLEDRFEIVKKVGEYKKENKLPARNKQREQAIVTERIKTSKLEAEFIRGIYKLIFNKSYKIEK